MTGARRFVMSTSTYTRRQRHRQDTDCRQCGYDCKPGTTVVSRRSRIGKSHIYCDPCAVRLGIIEAQKPGGRAHIKI